MRTIYIALILMLCSTVALAKPACKNYAAKAAPQTTIFDQVMSGLELRGGARWENTDAKHKLYPSTSNNRFYVGAGVSVPLNNKLGLRGGVDYKFSTKDWQPSIELSFRPSAR